MTAPFTPANTVDVLDLVRRQTYGAAPDAASLDMNNLFGPLANVSGPVPGLSDIYGGQPGGGPANNASAESTASSAAVGNAIGAIAANTISAMFSPFAPVAINTFAHTPTTFNALLSLLSPDPNAVPDDTTDTESTDTATSSVAADANADTGIGADDGTAADGDAGEGSADSGTSGDSGGTSGDSAGTGGDGGSAGADGGYFDGGFVPGPDVGKDNVNVNLAGGEVVIPSRIVDMLGHNFFEDLLMTKSPLEIAAEKEAKTAAKMKASA